ncbi:MAG TPA: hypothetical protein VGO53_16045 [Steroidobacteraceae bacterium]|jgi:hypothetical protein|nr:hypothetical protein [Steroidobacteraceae bacterium]
MTLEHITDHEVRGSKLLTEQFKHKATIAALLKSWLGQIQELEDATYQLQLQRVLGTATGANLDVLGELVGQARAGRSDTQYRVWIAGRVLVNKSRGKTVQLIAIASKLTQGPVRLAEYYPASFTIYSGAPIRGSDGVEIAKLLHIAKAAGVAMQFVWYDSATAFRFAISGVPNMDSPRGFGLGRFAAVSDGRDMAFDDVPPPVFVGGGGGELLVVL